MGDQTTLRGEEEGASQDMRGVRKNFHHAFLAILKNALSDGEERAGRPHPHPGGLLDRMGWGMRNLMATDFAKAFWRWYCMTQQKVCYDCQRLCGENLEIGKALNTYKLWFFMSYVRVISKTTPYLYTPNRDWNMGLATRISFLEFLKFFV